MRESPASSIKPGTEGELSLREAGHADAPGARVERLYDDYAGRIYGYCLSRLDSPEEAEDALQATYLNAWRSLNSGVEPLSSRPWLFQIAANVCSSMLRTRLGGAAVELRSPETFDHIPTNDEPNDDLLGLSAALAGLPERQRRALLLRDWRGLSYDEIAAELGSSYQAVETLLFRARKSVAAGLRSPEPELAKVPAAGTGARAPSVPAPAQGWPCVDQVRPRHQRCSDQGLARRRARGGGSSGRVRSTGARNREHEAGHCGRRAPSPARDALDVHHAGRCGRDGEEAGSGPEEASFASSFRPLSGHARR